MNPIKMPEDILNLELKYIDENIRPLYHECNETIAQYEANQATPQIVIIKFRGLNRSLIPTNRFSVEEIAELDKQIENAKQLIKTPNKFKDEINKIFHKFSWEIAEKKLFSRYAPKPEEEELDEKGAYVWV